MRAYSQDLRDRALQALGRGESLASISRRLEVSRQWVCDVRDRMVLHGERGPQRVGGHRRSRVESLQTELRSWLQADPGLTLQAMCARLAERHQVEIKSPALWHQLNRWGLSLKKKPCTPASKNGRTYSKRVVSGRLGRASLIPRGWCFLTKPAPAPR